MQVLPYNPQLKGLLALWVRQTPPKSVFLVQQQQLCKSCKTRLSWEITNSCFSKRRNTVRSCCISASLREADPPWPCAPRARSQGQDLTVTRSWKGQCRKVPRQPLKQRMITMTKNTEYSPNPLISAPIWPSSVSFQNGLQSLGKNWRIWPIYKLVEAFELQ